MPRVSVSEKDKKRTIVIFDGDNFEISLEKIGLGIYDLRLFVYNFLDKKDSLVGMTNLEGVSYKPIIYVVGKRIGEDKRKIQNSLLNKLKKKNPNLVKIKAVKPKKLRSGCWSSSADSVISPFISMALFDKSIEKILIISGDGDFLETLEIIGVVNKKIHLIGINGSISRQLEDYVSFIGGMTSIVRKKMSGLEKLAKSDVKIIESSKKKSGEIGSKQIGKRKKGNL